MKFEVETGNYSTIIEGDSLAQAVKSAWAENPPEFIGNFVRFRHTEHDADKCWHRGRWKYIDPMKVIEWAGIEVRGGSAE